MQISLSPNILFRLIPKLKLAKFCFFCITEIFFNHYFFFIIVAASFEDKRRENYEKGQAELERRRKALLDAQRRETEERLRRYNH